MPKYGLLIDYEYCIGCRACEQACQQEHKRPHGEYGIYVDQVEPEISGGKLYFIPFPTDKCNLCGKRLSKGLKPACVHNCWAKVMKSGTIEELSKEVRKKVRSVLWAPH